MEIELLSAEGFRRLIAGLEDPSRKVDDFSLLAVEADAVSLVSILPEVFGEELDRKTLWERIANGIATATAKSAGDVGIFLQEILSYIKADPGKVASNDRLALHMETMLSRPVEIRYQFLRSISAKSYIIVTKARVLWNANKVRPMVGGAE